MVTAGLSIVGQSGGNSNQVQWLTVHFQGGHHGQEAERDGEGHEQEADRAGEDLVIVLYLN